MAVVSVFKFFMVFVFEALPEPFIFLEFITVSLTVNGIAFFLYRIKGGDHPAVLSLACLAIAIISAVIGRISYANDDSIILRGLEAELIWVFVSVPSLVLAIVHFIVSYIHLSKRANDPKDRS